MLTALQQYDHTNHVASMGRVYKAALEEKGRLVQLTEALQGMEGRIAAAEEAHVTAMKAREILSKVAIETQKNFEVQISSIVSMALMAVFADPYEFLLRFETRRNQTEADILLVKNGEEVDPEDSVGGGVMDVVSFALRVAVVVLRQKRQTIILDEPFKHLSADLQPKASAMLLMLSNELGIQFIIVSHEDGIIECADRAFTISNGQVIQD